MEKHSGSKLEPSSFPVLSFCKCLVCVLFIYTVFSSIICASQEELSLIVSNEEIKRLLQLSNILKEKTLWKVNFWYQWIIQCNTDSCCEHMAVDVNIYSSRCGYGCLFLCMCVKQARHRSIISLSEITHQMWHNHPFRQRKKTSKIAVEVKVGGTRKDGLDKSLKR